MCYAKEDTWLYKYNEAIKKGEEVVGQELQATIDMVLDAWDDDKYYFDPSYAYKLMSFMEGCIKLTKAPFAGKPMKLMLFQKALIETMYSWKMTSDDTDRFQKIVLLIARKNTKSETCSAITLSQFFLGGAGQDLVCSSNDDAQANIVYTAIDDMRQFIDPLSKETHKNQSFIKCKFNGSKIFKLSDRTRNKEGRNIDFAIIDEVHEMKDNVIVKSIEQSQSLKPNPKMIIITTEGFINNGYLDAELIRCRKILRGEDTSVAAQRTLPWFYTQDSEQELWENKESWRKSNPTLGIVKKWSYLEEQLELAKQSKADRVFVLTKDFNIKQSNSQSWLTLEQIKNDSKFDIKDYRGALAVGAVDLAETTDLTSAKVLFRSSKDDKKYVLSHYWIPQGKLEKANDKGVGAEYAEWERQGYLTVVEGNEIDLTVVADWFANLYKEYGIRVFKVGYDVKFSKEFLNRMDDYGLETEMIIQNKQTLSAPMKLTEADLDSKIINYNDNPIDAWCLSNASVEVDNFGLINCVKINNQRSRRIDGAVTMIMANEMYRRYRSILDSQAI